MPRRSSRNQADSFIKQNLSWIKQQQEKLSSIPRLETDDWVYIFGKKYQKQTEFERNRPIGCYIEGDLLKTNPIDPLSNTKNQEKKTINKFLKSTARHYLLPRTDQLSEKMQLNFGKITLREQKSRWGSCSSEGNLNFNWRLVHFSPEVIDYVIIHELAHLTHMNHSKRFWNLVARFDPEYAKHRGVLHRFGAQLH